MNAPSADLFRYALDTSEERKERQCSVHELPILRSVHIGQLGTHAVIRALVHAFGPRAILAESLALDLLARHAQTEQAKANRTGTS